MENRNRLVIDLRVGQAGDRAECEQGLEVLQEIADHGKSQWPAKGCDAAGFVASCRALKLTSHDGAE